MCFSSRDAAGSCSLVDAVLVIKSSLVKADRKSQTCLAWGTRTSVGVLLDVFIDSVNVRKGTRQKHALSCIAGVFTPLKYAIKPTMIRSASPNRKLLTCDVLILRPVFFLKPKNDLLQRGTFAASSMQTCRCLGCVTEPLQRHQLCVPERQ